MVGVEPCGDSRPGCTNNSNCGTNMYCYHDSLFHGCCDHKIDVGKPCGDNDMCATGQCFDRICRRADEYLCHYTCDKTQSVNCPTEDCDAFGGFCKPDGRCQMG